MVLALDDVLSFAEAAQDLGVPPISGPQIVAAALEAAGCGTRKAATWQEVWEGTVLVNRQVDHWILYWNVYSCMYPSTPIYIFTT